MPHSPPDINKVLGIDSFDKSNSTVIFESDPKNTPEELKEVPRDIDPTLSIPLPYQKKTHKFTKET